MLNRYFTRYALKALQGMLLVAFILISPRSESLEINFYRVTYQRIAFYILNLVIAGQPSIGVIYKESFRFHSFLYEIVVSDDVTSLSGTDITGTIIPFNIEYSVSSPELTNTILQSILGL